MFDFSGFGIYSNFYIEIAAHHLTEPQVSFISGSGSSSILNTRYTAHMGTEITPVQNPFIQRRMSPYLYIICKARRLPAT